MKQQAVKATPEQIERAIKRQRAGLKPEFADLYPKTELALGALTLIAFFGGLILAWIDVGAAL